MGFFVYDILRVVRRRDWLLYLHISSLLLFGPSTHTRTCMCSLHKLSFLSTKQKSPSLYVCWHQCVLRVFGASGGFPIVDSRSGYMAPSTRVAPEEPRSAWWGAGRGGYLRRGRRKKRNPMYPAVCLPFSIPSMGVLCDRFHPWFTQSVYAGHRGKGQKVGEYGRLHYPVPGRMPALFSFVGGIRCIRSHPPSDNLYMCKGVRWTQGTKGRKSDNVADYDSKNVCACMYPD